MIQRINGDAIPDGVTVTPDHRVQTFVIKVRSLSGVHADTIKDQLQKKWEVDETLYVR